MLMSYVGALKAWIYGPILRNLGSNLYTLRVPVLLAGVASLWLFFLLLRRVAGERAALIGCAILATDSLYLLTTTFDWGPVAFQHLLLIGGALALVRFFQEGRLGALAGAGFLFGLALFDKALAIWSLSGLAVAGLLFYPRQVFRATTLRHVAVAVLAFALGALPLIYYNIDSKGGTFQGNFERNTRDVPGKGAFLFRTFSGWGLFGWMTANDEQTPEPHAPATALEKATARISALAGHPRHSLFLYAFLLSLLAAPFAGWPALRLVLFALTLGAVAWIQMAVNQNTGGSIHHTILLWPIPQFIVAVSFAGVSYRLGRAGIPAAATITAVVAISGALVINEYFVMAVRNGGAPFWTDGIYSLSRYLKEKPANWIFALDWSIADQLRLLSRGRLQVGIGSDQVAKPEMNAEDREIATRMLAIPDCVYVAHTPEFEVFKGPNERLLQFATAAGYRREHLATIPDSFGRKVYEVYRYVK
jgi:4-amino-4-deoxy-L-arabinose transferase-like glycosyltransferase